jgi:hypothetical protein
MSWYFPQLEKAFHLALRMIGDKSLCIFVVGLDIFEGDHERLPDFSKEFPASQISRFVFPATLSLYSRSF